VRTTSSGRQGAAGAEAQARDRARARAAPPPPIGVLALQGDFAAHAAALARAGAMPSEVRAAADLERVDALVVPGGESTTLLKLLREFGLWEPLRAFAARGRAIFGTCAGLILFAEEVRGPAQDSLGILPISVVRNAYGRQVDSFVDRGRVRVPAQLRPALGGGESFAADFVFIRAPRIARVGPGVEVLAEHAGDPVLVRSGAILGATFHPELSPGDRVHELFLSLAVGVGDAAHA